MTKKKRQKKAGIVACRVDKGVFISPLGKVISWEECEILSKEILHGGRGPNGFGKISEKKITLRNEAIYAARYAINFLR